MASSRTPRAALVTGLTPRFAIRPERALLRSVPRAVLAFALTAVCLAATSVARAELDLDWRAPPGCPDRARVLAKIREMAGSALDGSDALSVKAEITREAGRSRLELIVRDGRRIERRVITSHSCSALAGAVAVTLTLLLSSGDAAATTDDAPAAREPGAGAGTEPSSRAAGAEPRAERDQDAESLREQGVEAPRERSVESPDEDIEAETRDAGATRSPAETSSERAWALIVRAPVASADLGPLPRPALGLGVGVGLRHGVWAVSVSGQYSRSQSVDSVVQIESSGAELERLTAQLLTCRGWRWAALELSPCLGLTLEHVTARGFGEGVSPQAQRALWPAPGVAVVAHWHALRSLALFATLGSYLELSRPRFVIADLGDVEQLGPASLSAALGLEWIL